MLSTMQDGPLLISKIYERGRDYYGDREVVTWQGDSAKRATFKEVAARAEKLAAALQRLGVQEGDRVGSFSLNNQEHMEIYLAVPSMGAVLHTINIRLFPEQLVYIINHAADRVLIVDGMVAPFLAAVRAQLTTVEYIIVTASGDGSSLGDVLSYEDLLAAEETGYVWPDLDERAAASICYTSGTTGNPKGIVYSHRSVYLHSMCCWGEFSLKEGDRLLTIVPMFHVNAWGLPYAGWMIGCDLLMASKFVQPEPLTRFIAEEKPSFSGAVPTVWNEVLQYAETHAIDVSSLELVICGGAPVPRALMERFQERHGLRIIQAWGMTETSPIAAVAYPPKSAPPQEEWAWRSKTGRVVPGVELRITAPDGSVLPRDGVAVGEIEVRGPWITGSYYGVEDPAKFNDGWLRTGDVGNFDAKGFIQITDRSKDVIKSGGEWISSVEIENILMGHPDILEASVVGVPDPKWDERPLASVVVRQGVILEAGDLQTYLSDKIAKWWMPERWAFVEQIPKTSVGKFDKKVLRSMYAEGKLNITELQASERR